MADKIIENNQVSMMGKIAAGFTFSHQVFGEGFYMTELLVKKLTAEKKERPAADPLSVNYVEEAARELSGKLGRPCRIVNGKKKGRVELEYYGVDDLNALLEALEKLKK